MESRKKFAINLIKEKIIKWKKMNIKFSARYITKTEHIPSSTPTIYCKYGNEKILDRLCFFGLDKKLEMLKELSYWK